MRTPDLRRRCGSYPVLAAVLLLLARPAAAGTIIVEGACTLVDAITAANTDAPAGSCPAGSGPDEIHLTADVSLAVVDNVMNGPNGLPSVTSHITVVGNGFSVEREDGAPQFRIFRVGTPGTLELVGVVVANGATEENGGGIRTQGLGGLTLTSSTVSGSSAGFRGGGIFAAKSVVIRDGSLVTGNSAKEGGGICSGPSGGAITITDSTVSGNLANARGGGISMGDDAGAITLQNSVVSDNQSNNGGGIALPIGGSLFQGGLSIEGSTLVGNSAATAGGAIHSDVPFGGDGVTITNSTLSGNIAGQMGGAIHDEDGFIDVVHGTLSGNSAPVGGGLSSSGPDGPIVLRGTIVANSMAGGDCVGSGVQDDGSNFSGDGTCPGTPITPDVDFDTVLADNGGPTPTHALLAGSVAADAAGACGLATDQRGFLREDGACDGGSFELGGGKPGLRASVTGMTLRKVSCTNFTTGQSGASPGQSGVVSWTCDELGVATGGGDRLQLGGLGVANGVSPVGGSVNEFPAPIGYRVTCRNLSTAQTVSFGTVAGAWDCEAQGLVVAREDRIAQLIGGELEAESTFEEHILSGAADAPVFATDLDGDGDTDVLAGSEEDLEFRWFENDGGSPPAFTERLITTSADHVTSLHATDVDGDGDVDIVASSPLDGKIIWYQNAGGTPLGFVERIISTTASSVRAVYAADLDGDGDTDVLSAYSVGNKFFWYESDGGATPTFTLRFIQGTSDRSQSVYAADVDGDGDTDVLAVFDELFAALDDTVAWYESDGGSPPVFTERIISQEMDGPKSIHARDVDGDGATDVLVAFQLDDTVAWYENAGGVPPVFTARILSTTADGASSVLATDVDGDGDTDVLSAASVDSAPLTWYENDGGSPPVFTEQIIPTTVTSASSLHAADVDGDGDVDVVSGFAIGVAWYEQLVAGAGPEAEAPQ